MDCSEQPERRIIPTGHAHRAHGPNDQHVLDDELLNVADKFDGWHGRER